MSRTRLSSPGWRRVLPESPYLSGAIHELVRSASARHRVLAMLDLPDDPRFVAERSRDALVRAIHRFVVAGRAHLYQAEGLPPIAARGGGEVPPPSPPEPPEPVPPSEPPPAPPVEQPYVDTLRLRSVTFTSDFGVLKDEETVWKNQGAPYGEPEWEPGVAHPLVHKMNEPLVLRVEGTVGPDGALPRTGILKASGGGLRFATSTVTFAAGRFSATLTSDGPLPEKIQKLSLSLSWSIEGGPVGVAPSSTRNDVYVTYDRPLDDGSGGREDGVTQKRMDRAVEWVGGTGSLSPHAIVEKLMAKFPGYRLSPSDIVPPEFGHPAYFNEVGGAWPMSDYVRETGECQAIVRVVRGAIRQVGVPGEARVYVVWSEPHVDGGRTAVEADWEASPRSGLDTSRTVGGVLEHAALADGAVVVGQDYPPSHAPMPDGSGTSPGLNRYEACLRFTAEGTTKYYGGGAGTFASKDEVILAFWGLVWVRFNPDGGYHVTEIVHTYR